jgi:chaperonin GroES
MAERQNPKSTPTKISVPGVVVKRIDENTQRDLYISDTFKDKPQMGEVVAIGKNVKVVKGKSLPVDVQVGDRILFGKYTGSDIKLDGNEYLVMSEDQILGILANEPRKTSEPHKPVIGRKVRSKFGRAYKVAIHEIEKNLAATHSEMRKEVKEVTAIQELATKVFGNKAAGMEWLQEPNIATFDKPPIALLSSNEGFERVKNLLMRIEYGNLA